MSRLNHGFSEALASYLTSRSSTSTIVNNYIRIACIGISGAVFVAFQYALRDGSTFLADPDIWRGLDSALPPGTRARVHRFLDDNFVLRVGDEQSRPWNLLTSSFSHIDWGHFTANTLAFTSFTNTLKYIVSPVSFVGIILSTSLASSVAFLSKESGRKVPNQRVRSLGMSGITAGIGVATAVFVPHQSVSLYGVPVPVWIALTGFSAYDFLFLNSTTSTVGHASHLGGAAAGLIYALSLKFLGGIHPPFWMTSASTRW